jgi:hypothetical protein
MISSATTSPVRTATSRGSSPAATCVPSSRTACAVTGSGQASMSAGGTPRIWLAAGFASRISPLAE